MDILYIVLTGVILLIASPFLLGIAGVLAYIISNLFVSKKDD